jgi:hypothetical protein
LQQKTTTKTSNNSAHLAAQAPAPGVNGIYLVLLLAHDTSDIIL